MTVVRHFLPLIVQRIHSNLFLAIFSARDLSCASVNSSGDMNVDAVTVMLCGNALNSQRNFGLEGVWDIFAKRPFI